MKVLFNKTFEKMFKLIPVSICVGISGIGGFILSHRYHSLMKSRPSYHELSQELLLFYALLAFVLLAGMVIWLICSNYSSGLFSSEIHEGTMRLLLAKRISRLELVVGKVGGMLVGSVVYLIICFSSFLSVFMVFSGVEKDILWMIIKASVAFIGYGIVLIFILGSIGTFLSSCFKKKVPAILILVVLAALVFGIIPFIRMFLINVFKIYDSKCLYLVDINYHLSLIFNQFLGFVDKFDLSLGNLGLFGMFTNLYSYGIADFDLSISALYSLNQSLNSTIIIILYLASSCALYVLSYYKMARKDI